MLYFDDIVVGSVAEFGDYAVTREDIIAFAQQYDPQPFHLDEEAAKASLFGTVCASGWHTCAMMMRMLVEHQAAQGAQGLGSPGIDQLRWLKPVLPGHRLTVRSEVLEAKRSKSKPGLGIVTSAITVLTQEGEAVMTLTASTFMRCRPAA